MNFKNLKLDFNIKNLIYKEKSKTERDCEILKNARQDFILKATSKSGLFFLKKFPDFKSYKKYEVEFIKNNREFADFEILEV